MADWTHETRREGRACAESCRSAVWSVGAPRIVFPQQLIANERIRIAADHSVPAHRIVRPNGHAGTKPIVWIRLGIIGSGTLGVRLGICGLGGDKGAKR